MSEQTDIVERLRIRERACHPKSYADDARDGADEIERLRAALKRIADDDVDEDLRNNLSIIRGIAWAALTDTSVHRR